MAAAKGRGVPFLSNKNIKRIRVVAGQASCAIGIDRDLSRIEIYMRPTFFLSSIRTRKQHANCLVIRASRSLYATRAFVYALDY